MIPCPKCGYDNPMGAVFCRGCGVRIEVSLQMINVAVKQTNTASLDTNIMKWGRSAVSLSVFLLICALLLRYVAVPKPPPPDIPHAPDLQLFPSTAPWAAKAVAAPDVPSVKSLLPDTNRLAWRHQQGPALLSVYSLDLQPIIDALEGIAALQLPDGSFPGTQPMAATALAALALQAWPRDSVQLAAAEKARAWISGRWKDINSQPPLCRALASVALADAEVLSEAQRSQQGVLLVDGSSPVWQAFLLPLLPASQRPITVALENKLKSPAWTAWFEVLNGRQPEADVKTWLSQYANELKTAEERFQWTQLSWFHPLMPTDLADVLRAWNKVPGASTTPELETFCGPIAKPAMYVLTLTAPLRIPILRLSR